MCQPPRRLAHLVVDARLLLDGAPEPCAGNANQRPSAVEIDDEGPSGVTETGVALPFLVTGTEHLLVQLNGDRFVLVPAATLAVVDYWNQDLKRAEEQKQKFELRIFL